MEEHERIVKQADEKLKRRTKKGRPSMRVSGRGMKRFGGKTAPKR